MSRKDFAKQRPECEWREDGGSCEAAEPSVGIMTRVEERRKYMDELMIGQLAKRMNLTNLTPEVDMDTIALTTEDINRPALQLAGFFDHFDCHRVQIIGNVESAYIKTLSRENKLAVFDKLFGYQIPCLVYCRGNLPDEDVLALARKHNVPLLATKAGTSETSARILRYTLEILSPTLTIHGVLIDVFGEGVLIIGESGIGKSEAALELIKRGHRLVADDAVELRRINDEILMGSAPEVTRHFIELRGIGIIDVKTLFGVESVKDSQQVDMAIRLEEWNREKAYDRLGSNEEYLDYLGNKVVCFSIPIRPGRNVAVIVESAAVNYRQKKMGYDAVEELYKRVQNNMIKNR